MDAHSREYGAAARETETDLYAILMCPRDASDDQLLRAAKQMLRKCAAAARAVLPTDSSCGNGEIQSAQQCKQAQPTIAEVLQARDVLCDPHRVGVYR